MKALKAFRNSFEEPERRVKMKILANSLPTHGSETGRVKITGFAISSLQTQTKIKCKKTPKNHHFVLTKLCPLLMLERCLRNV